VFSQVVVLFDQVKESPTPKFPQQIGELLIDKSYSWGFFDGACQGLDKPCGLGGLLFLSDEHFYTFKENDGRGSNKPRQSFQTLILLFKKSHECGLRALQVYGDSLLVVNWMKGKHLILNVELQVWLNI
jgi:ribonuclease HI